MRDLRSTSFRAVAGKLNYTIGILGVATPLLGTLLTDASARDSFYSLSRPYVPRSYYTPYFDGRSRFDDGYADPLIRRTADQLRRAPKPPPTKGPLLISISLASQRLTLYDDGVPIAHSPISSGNAGFPTPTGVFSVIQKQRWHRSNLYSAAPMPFMQRITWSGVALHAGQLPGYPASHGCIRLPDDFAVRLWQTTSTGARVVISQREIAPAAISHARLFVLPPAAVPLAQKPSALPAQAVVQAPPATPGNNTTGTPADASANSEAVATKSETKVAFAGNADATGQPAVEKPLRAGPVSVFISRKERRLYVRKGFEPLFDMPVIISNPDQALGTHLFVAMSAPDGSLQPRWMVVSPPPQESGKVEARRDAGQRSHKHRASEPSTAPVQHSSVAASAALDRIEMPPDAVLRIAELMSVGAALTISDEGLGPETGRETDFTVVTSPLQPTKRVRPSYDRYDYWRPYSRRWF